jgi:hypothetical protein
MTDINVREVQFVAFALYRFLNSRAKSLIVCILRRIPTATNHLFYCSARALLIRTWPVSRPSSLTCSLAEPKMSAKCRIPHL